MDFGPCINEILEYIPENERPDMSDVIEYFNKEFSIENPVAEPINGRLWTSGFNEEMAQWVYDKWNPKKNDVIICSFPKTGTTWARDIVNSIFNKDNERIRRMVEKMSMPHLYLETGLPKKFEMLDKLPWQQKILTTHLTVDLVNMDKIRSSGAKIIYIMRNPKDVAVSYFHMFKNMKQIPDDWQMFFENVLSGKVVVSMKEGEWYLDHLLGWYKHKNDENMLFVVYEDLKKNPQTETLRIAKFLEVDLTNEELLKLTEITSFGAMKSKAIHWEKEVNFFRKGDIGSWKNCFTVAQSEVMDEKVKEKLSSTDISFVYE